MGVSAPQHLTKPIAWTSFGERMAPDLSLPFLVLSLPFVVFSPAFVVFSPAFVVFSLLSLVLSLPFVVFSLPFLVFSLFFVAFSLPFLVFSPAFVVLFTAFPRVFTAFRCVFTAFPCASTTLQNLKRVPFSTVGNLWRTGGDIGSNYGRIVKKRPEFAMKFLVSDCVDFSTLMAYCWCVFLVWRACDRERLGVPCGAGG